MQNRVAVVKASADHGTRDRQSNVFRHAFPNMSQSLDVKVRCFAHAVYMGGESQRVVNDDSETLNAIRRTNFGISDDDKIERTFRSVPSAGSNDNGFSLVRVERQAV